MKKVLLSTMAVAAMGFADVQAFDEDHSSTSLPLASSVSEAPVLSSQDESQSSSSSMRVSPVVEFAQVKESRSKEEKKAKGLLRFMTNVYIDGKVVLTTQNPDEIIMAISEHVGHIGQKEIGIQTRHLTGKAYGKMLVDSTVLYLCTLEEVRNTLTDAVENQSNVSICVECE